MIPSHAVGMNSISRPASDARRLATSISKPTSSPCLLRMAQGTKVDTPTRMVPRCLIWSSRLGREVSVADPQPVTISAAAQMAARIYLLL